MEDKYKFTKEQSKALLWDMFTDRLLIKDETNNEFFFFGTGSPAYYVSAGEDSGVNLSAYAGDIPEDGVLGTFETIQIRSVQNQGCFR